MFNNYRLSDSHVTIHKQLTLTETAAAVNRKIRRQNKSFSCPSFVSK